MDYDVRIQKLASRQDMVFFKTWKKLYEPDSRAYISVVIDESVFRSEFSVLRLIKAESSFPVSVKAGLYRTRLKSVWFFLGVSFEVGKKWYSEFTS